MIIVARYNEDISWTNEFENVLIYNKGTPLNLPNEIILPNVGREPHTYYKYIYDNYDNLDDYVVFLQGNPFDHSPNIIDNLKNLPNLNFHFLSEHILSCSLSGCIHHPGLPLIPVYRRIFNKRLIRNRFTFGAGAQFMVSKEQILKRPRDFYLNIVNMLGHSQAPIEAWVIERFHQLIFSN